MSLDSEAALKSIDRMTIAMNRLLALTLMVDLGDNMELPIMPDGIKEELTGVIDTYRGVLGELERSVIGPIIETVESWNVPSSN